MGILTIWEKFACKDGSDWPDRRSDLTGQDDDGAIGLRGAGDISVAPLLAIEVRRAAGSGGCHQFFGVIGGAEYFVSAAK